MSTGGYPVLSPFFFCGWWYTATGQPLPGCLGKWWLMGALRPAGPWWWWDLPGLGGPATSRRVGPAGQQVMVGPGVQPEAQVGPGPGLFGQPKWAGLGQFQPQPLPGAQYAPPVGPAGPLGAPWAERAGPGVPQPWLRGPGVPGVPIVPVSPGEAGEEIGP